MSSSLSYSPPETPCPCQEAEIKSHSDEKAAEGCELPCVHQRVLRLGTRGLGGGEPHMGLGQAGGRGRHSTAPRHGHLLSLAPSGWLRAGQQPSLQWLSSAKTFLSPCPACSLRICSVLHLGRHLGWPPPWCMPAWGARRVCAHACEPLDDPHSGL